MMSQPDKTDFKAHGQATRPYTEDLGQERQDTRRREVWRPRSGRGSILTWTRYAY